MLVRFAPSPTGYLHVGNVRTALINWLFARQGGGQFMLRIDDTDAERSRAEYEVAIKEDLQWLGLNWDREEKQSERFARYDAARAKLIADGRLYPCYETPEELEIKRKMLISRGLPPIYDRGALKLTDAQKQAYEAEGRRPHWRFKLADQPIAWEDMIRGPVQFEAKHLADPVLIREDGVPLFTFATAVDDGEHGVTHILRGEDHVSNTALQLQVMEALGHAAPTLGHMALLRMGEGKLSKREGGGSLRELRGEGVFPLVVASYLAKIGTSDAIELADSMEGLVAGFAISKLGRAPAHYDPEEMGRLNAKLLHSMPFEVARPALAGLGLASVDADFWEQVKGNLLAFEEVRDWWALLREPITPEIGAEDKDFTQKAAELLPEVLDEASWAALVEQLKAETGRKGKGLFMPLRLALTARTDGPELPKIAALLGRERAAKRLRGEAA